MKASSETFLERVKSEILVGDGAFGTRLYEKGFSLDVSYESLNLSRPALVEEILGEYIQAGADVIETNTFCANRHKQKRFAMDEQIGDMVSAAAKIARKVVGPDQYVAGSVGPLVRRRRELDEYSEEEIRELFREPMTTLVEGGVDVLYLETFTLLYELELALEVALEFDIPVICQMAYGEEGTTDAGVTAERSARRLVEKGAHLVGANCRSGPTVLSEVIQRQSEVCNVPLAVYPNAGYAQQVDGRYIYQASPQYFGEVVSQLVESGATLVGGCCGTSVGHVEALSHAVKQLKPAKRKQISVTEYSEPRFEVGQQEGGASFRALLNHPKRFVTVEIEPPRGLNLKKSLDGARLVAEAGCDSINVPDNPLAIVRMDNVIFADLLRQHVDLPVIMHLTCRDKNIIALQSNLLGAQMVGIEAILAVTGDPAAIGDQPGATSVYDVKSIGLIDMISSLNRGLTQSGRNLKKPTDFAIGVALNPNVRGEKGMESMLMKLQKKIDAGANFAETQPMYDPEVLAAFLQTLKQIEIPVCIGLMPIMSHGNAEFFHNEVPGVKIPKEIRDRFVGLSKEEGEREGVAQAKSVIDLCLKEGATNFYIVPPLRRYHVAAELTTYIKTHA